MGIETSENQPRRTEPRPGDVIAGKYKIEAMIGRGAMGSVYAARNQLTAKRVALKWLLAERQSDHEMVARFEREARAAGRIDHPNVVSVFDVGRDGPSSFLVMELLRGYSLQKLLRQGPLPAEAAIQILMPAMRGIHAAHAHNVIHRDLKPENVFLCTSQDGTPRESKVLDFGVSKMTDELREGLSVTRTGMVIGTPYYMAPEQIRGGQDIDHRIDVYALGVLLFEMLAGRPPFVAEHYAALVVEIATADPPDLCELRPEIPRELAEVIGKGMARHREDRYPDVESFAVDLEPFGGGITFVPRKADWTARIKLPPHSTPPPAPIEVVESGVVADSMVATQAPADDPLVAATTAARVPVDVSLGGAEPSPSESGTVAATPSTDPMGAEEPPPSPATPAAGAARKRMLIGGVLVAFGVIALVVAMTVGGSDTEPPGEVGSAPATESAEATEVSAEDPGTDSQGTPTDEGTPDVAATDPESAEDPAAGTTDGAGEGDNREEGAGDSPAMADVDEAGEDDRRAPGTHRGTIMRRPRMRPSTTQGSVTMREHRAGELSIEDF